MWLGWRQVWRHRWFVAAAPAVLPVVRPGLLQEYVLSLLGNLSVGSIRDTRMLLG